MARISRALAAAVMAIAVAGGGLLVTAAGAVPASAATQVSPAGGHPGGHVVATITMRPAGRTGPSVIQPCAVHRPGAAPAYGDGGGCDSGTVTCDVIAFTPSIGTPPYIYFEAETHCSEDVPRISMGQDVIHSTPIDPNNPLTDSKVTTNKSTLATFNQAVCQPGQYAVSASARITPPDGDILVGSQQDTSATVAFTASQCGTSGGGGGGGGCATATPSVSGHRAARRPDVITCGG
ncbi:MAG TPA: hypothetical protein VF204_15125 [Streptosporangiaceae bacterium]